MSLRGGHHLVGTLDMARGDDQHEAGARLQHTSITGKHGILFARMRAPRQKDVLVRPNAQFRPAARDRRGRIDNNLIEFEVAGPRHSTRIGTEPNNPLHVTIGLHGAERKGGQHSTKERCEPKIALKRIGGEAAVDENGGDAARRNRSQKIRPQLGFDAYKRPRSHGIKRATHAEGKIQREIHVPRLFAQPAQDRLPTGLGHRGNKNPVLRVPALERLH